MTAPIKSNHDLVEYFQGINVFDFVEIYPGQGLVALQETL